MSDPCWPVMSVVLVVMVPSYVPRFVAGGQGLFSSAAWQRQPEWKTGGCPVEWIVCVGQVFCKNI